MRPASYPTGVCAVTSLAGWFRTEVASLYTLHPRPKIRPGRQEPPRIQPNSHLRWFTANTRLPPVH